jgi:hypothetical protein
MKKFVFLYYGMDEPTPEVMAAWGSWFESIGDKLVDGGNPFGAGRVVTKNGATDLSAAMKPATGYSIVNADSIDAAQKLLDGCPAHDGVQVYEALPL